MAGQNDCICTVCHKRVLANAKHLKCDCCSSMIHKICTTLFKTEFEEIITKKRSWSCSYCNENIFPFNSIEDENIFLNAIDMQENNKHYLTSISRDRLFEPFEINDNDYIHQDIDSDPDWNFYNELQSVAQLNSKYYIEKKFTEYVSPITMNGSNSMSFIHLNIRSARANLRSFETYLHTLDYSFDCICLTETWYTNQTSELYTMTGYNKIDRIRTAQQGGGVSVLLKEGIQYKERCDLSCIDDDIECIFVEAILAKKVIIGVIYRPPNRKIEDFNEKLKSIMDQIDVARLPCYLIGDTNINVINHSNHKETANYLEMMYSFGLVPVINRPTRITGHSATLIDHIFTNTYTASALYQGILLTDITDHFPIFHIAQFETKNTVNDEYIYKRIMSQKNYDSFHLLISQIDWANVTGCNDCQTSFSTFYDIIKRCYDKAFPIQKIKKGYNNRLPWLTDELKQSIKYKNKLYVKAKKHDTVFNKINYNDFKYSLQCQMKQKEKEYYNDMVIKNKSNMKKTWDIIKTVIGKKKRSIKYSEFIVDGKLTDNSNVIANKFNEYFAQIGPKLAKNIPKNCPPFSNFLKGSYLQTFYINSIQNDEIKKVILLLKDGAPGIDCIPASVLKYTVELVSSPLTHICQLSLNQGHFPSELKLAKIIPLYKSNDPSLFNNYRPISLLSVFSKIMEKIMYDRLYDYLITMKILYEYQFGFQKNKSTYMALISLTDKILHALENGDVCVGIFIDFRKAFDTVNHDILLDKLYYYGIRGVALDWFKSYLTDRKQCVQFNDVTSNVINMKCGVPQGSNLGPLLFLIYINDLAFVSPKLFAILFADDSNFFCIGKDLSSVTSIVNQELCTIVNWLNSNKMSLNIEKTHFMVFKPKRRMIYESCNITINGCKIDEVKYTKFLGVMIDSELSWKNHIDYISSKISKNIGLLSKARSMFSTETLTSLYYSFVYPYITYCIHVWGSTFQTHLNKMVVLQKRIIRIIAGVNRRTSSKPIFDSLGILPIQKVFEYNISLFMYKFHHGQLPSIFDIFARNSDVHYHYTRQNELLHLPMPRKEYVKRSFRYQAVLIWNVVYAHVNVNIKIGTFKKHLKRYLVLS